VQGPPVGVVADLLTIAQDVQWILTAQNLLHEVGDHVAHRELDVAAHDFDVAESPNLADSHAVEWPDDGVGESMLLPRRVGEVLDGELLEAV